MANLDIAEKRARVNDFNVMLPLQYFSRHKPPPEQRLMIAVLHDALECVEKHRFATKGRDRRLFREARQWFLDEQTAWPYSFECICGVLELDSKAVRQQLRFAP